MVQKYLILLNDNPSDISDKLIKMVKIIDAEDESEFDYTRGSEKGPHRWGELKKEWEACKNGGMQSPIDLANQRVKIVPRLGKLTRSCIPSNATIKNRGHDISVSKLIDKQKFR